MEKKATFGAGCFWGVEAAFRQVEGVTATAVGYEGGHTENPTYEDVCSRAFDRSAASRCPASWKKITERYWSPMSHS